MGFSERLMCFLLFFFVLLLVIFFFFLAFSKKYFHIFALSIPDFRYSLRPLSHSFLDTPTFPPVLARVFFPHPFPKMIRRNQFFCSFYSDKKKKLFFGVCCRFPSFTRCDFVDSFFSPRLRNVFSSKQFFFQPAPLPIFPPISRKIFFSLSRE